MSEQALAGLRVIDIGNIVAGPWASTILADFGADVIKVEPPTGDLIRGMGRIKNMWYCVEDRNKRCVTLNLKTPEGTKILEDLLRTADILVENFRPGVFARLGFSWARIQEINPRLVYVCCSGYGQTGPKAHKPGVDRIGLAEGGVLAVTGEPDGAPMRVGIAAADYATAMFAALGAMFAVYSRDIGGTGKGQMIDCALTDSMIRWQESIIAEYSYDGTIRQRMGNEAPTSLPCGHFKTKDDEYFVMSAAGVKQFGDWCTAIGRGDLLENPRYSTVEARGKVRAEVQTIASDWVRAHTIEECLEVLDGVIPCCKVFNVADILKDEQANLREMIIDVPTEEFGVVKMQGIVPKMSGTPGKVNWGGKSIGAFNEEVYSSVLGMSEAQIAALREKGVI